MTEEFSQLLGKLNFKFKKKLPLILQSENSECGVACLAMIAGYYGNHVNLTSLRAKFNFSPSGMSIVDIANFAESLALTSRPLRVELDDLPTLAFPCILHLHISAEPIS